MSDRISIRGIAVATSVAVASTGLAFAVHAVAAQPDPRTDSAVSRTAQPSMAAAREAREARADRASRTAARAVGSSGARDIAAALAASHYGWGADQFACLDSLWERESGWRVHAHASSGAYGIPQALPGSKMSAYGGDWRDNAVTQVEWGLSYIDERYGDPCGAWTAFRSNGWY